MDDKDEKSSESLDSPQTGSFKMSSSLKGRLKKSSRSSPISGFQKEQDSIPLKVANYDNRRFHEISKELSELTSDYIETCNDEDMLQNIYLNLQKELEENEEKLRKLEWIEDHHSKNKLEELTSLIEKWLSVSQESLRKLYEKLPENKGSIQDLLNMLNIDYNVINYDPESDTFLY